MLPLRRLGTRRLVRGVHVGVLQVFKLQPVPTPTTGDRLRLLFPSGAPRSSEESSVQLAQAAQEGRPVLMTLTALRSLLSSNVSGAKLLTESEEHAQLEGATVSSDGARDGASSKGANSNAATEGEVQLIAADGSTSALLAQQSRPLADVLNDGVEQPHWWSMAAPLPPPAVDPSAAQRDLLHAASQGEVDALRTALRDCSRRDVAEASLPPSGATALHLAATSGSLPVVEELLKVAPHSPPTNPPCARRLICTPLPSVAGGLLCPRGRHERLHRAALGSGRRPR